jgi:hypothetical protein
MDELQKTFIAFAFKLGGVMILAGLLGAVLKLLKARVKGKIGEGVLNLALKLKLDKSRYHLLNDITIPSGDSTTQIDHIVVSEFGVFVIESKNYQGWIFGDAKSKQWTQSLYKKKSRFQNPLHQNYGHIKALEAITGLPEEGFHTIVSFSVDSTFKTDMPETVMKENEVASYIKSFTNPIIDPDDLPSIIDAIESSALAKGWKTDRQHVNNLKAK